MHKGEGSPVTRLRAAGQRWHGEGGDKGNKTLACGERRDGGSQRSCFRPSVSLSCSKSRALPHPRLLPRIDDGIPWAEMNR